MSPSATPPVPVAMAHAVTLLWTAWGASAAAAGPSPARLAYQTAVDGTIAAKAATAKVLLMKDGDLAMMVRARAAATASAALLDKRRRAHTQDVLDKDAVVGEP